MSQPTFVAPAPTSSPSKKLPSGSYMARCFQMIALGTHTTTYKTDTNTNFKIWLGWECPGELDKFGDSDELKPYTLGKEYNFSMGEKSNLRRDLELWRGKKFTNEEAYSFDVGKLIGAVCQINWIDYIKEGNTPSMKIGSISRLMNGVIVPPAISPVQALSFNDFDHSLYESLPSFLKKKIAASPEYQALVNPHPTMQDTAPETASTFGNYEEDKDEPLPF